MSHHYGVYSNDSRPCMCVQGGLSTSQSLLKDPFLPICTAAHSLFRNLNFVLVAADAHVCAEDVLGRAGELVNLAWRSQLSTHSKFCTMMRKKHAITLVARTPGAPFRVPRWKRGKTRGPPQ
eukprot:1156527-Pelagomonas_calceolata.AAC.3